MPNRALLVSSLLACALASATASAGDGVIEVNAAAVQLGGITTGDTAGFPATLSKGGSYRLTGDLLSSSKAVPVIEITADRVSLDLNGFTVAACLGGGLCATGTAAAITASGQADVRIHDGTVYNAGSDCVRGGGRAVVEDLRIADCDGDGVSVAFYSTVAGVSISDVAGIGASMGAYSTLRNSTIKGSGSFGVVVNTNALLLDSFIAGNDGAVGSTGFSAATSGGYRGCVITLNEGSEEVQRINSVLLNLGGNVCGNDTTCP